MFTLTTDGNYIKNFYQSTFKTGKKKEKEKKKTIKANAKLFGLDVNEITICL